MGKQNRHRRVNSSWNDLVLSTPLLLFYAEPLVTLTNVSKQTSTNGYLLTSKEEVFKRFGKPTDAYDNTFYYNYWVQEQPSPVIENKLRKTHNLPKSETLWLDIYTVISFRFKQDQLIEFSVNTTKTF